MNQTFSYTHDKSTYLPIAGLFALLCVAESTVLGFLAVHFLDDPWHLWVAVAFVLLLGLVARALSAPLFTQHGWDGDNLAINYGPRRWLVKRDWIAAVEPVQESLSGLEPLAARYDEDEGRLTACFSESGQLLIRLKQPRSFKVGISKHAETDTLLINTEQAPLLRELLGFNDQTTTTQPTRDQPTRALQSAATTSPPTQPRPQPAAKPSLDPEAAPVLAIRALTKQFGEVKAVDQLDLNVAPGEIVALLGCNGAGKTTTIKMITGLLEPDGGQVVIGGHDLWRDGLAAKELFGYVPDHAAFYGKLSGREQLQFIAQVRGLPRAESEAEIDRLIAELDLTQAQHRGNAGYSLGMKRKLSLAAAMLHHPKLLILDEPFNGLDPWAAQQLKTMLTACRAGGTAILLSTHDLATAERFCDRVAMLNKGCKSVDADVADLCAQHGGLEQAFFAETTR
ncbi:ABC transporter ATP-binding protein [Acanthopleuribacter pedis]|uniref:ABC transporter ATP-binding protein n=1 Tax=Acanthopleuribacter pedis TaxID=442870 RepID=A0A8J7QFX6_9BACT|nr:ABC transporter ATP-binding protein [Acanthopleuribacter pedis]MBO1319265.1 ABC transporter ATP-binding protein [Acanthopleuribacter pedis]